MDCPNCQHTLKDDELYCIKCMGKYNAQSGREEDGLVIGRISASIIDQHDIEVPEQKHELEKLLQKLGEDDKYLDSERVKIHNLRTNVQWLISGIRSRLYPSDDY